MKRLSLLFSAALLLAAGAPLCAQTDLTGYWAFRVQRNDGTFTESFFELKQEGGAIAGRSIQGTRETPIAEGTFADGKLHFVVNLPAGRGGNAGAQIVYDGAAGSGANLSLTSRSSAGNRPPVTGEFVRTTKEATMPPARLPLPDLHDVRDNGLARTPPMGWNSWNKFAGRVTEEDVRGMADAMVASGMSKVGYTYINIDDTWEGQGRDRDGNITTNKKFPDMKALADYVHSKGLKIGIYSSPGPKTCAGYEASYGHEEQDAKQFAAWGFDYLKYDWCSAGQIYKDEEMQAVYQRMGDALLKAGRPIVYSLCQYGRAEVWKWGGKVGGNLWRTTGDIRDAWQSLDRIGFGPAVPGQRTQLDIAGAMQPGRFNDPDMLEIGNGAMTNNEYQLHLSWWSLLSAPLLAGNDLRAMSDDIKNILMNTEVIAVDQDAAVKPPAKVSEQGATMVVSKTLADGSLAVGLFNRGADAATIAVKWSDLGIQGSRTVRDLWKHADLGKMASEFSAEVPSHGVVMVKIK